MPEILFVTWDGGGNVPPALGIGRELVARGHHVRVLGHAGQAHAVHAAGLEFVAPHAARAFRNRTDYTPTTMLRVFADPGMGRDLLAEVAARPADLVVVDCLMFGAMRAAADAGLPFAVLEHLYDAAYRRSMLGGVVGAYLRLRRLRPHQALAAAAARLLTSTPSLDPVPSPPGNLRRVGPVVEVVPRAEAAEASVLVSLSTFAYPGMQGCLQSVVDACRILGVRTVVTTGPAIDPASLHAPGVEVHRFVPHAELMRSATVLVGHGGHGTTMQALAHDLPALVMPMDRQTDQPLVGRTVADAGAGAVVRKGSSPARVAAALAPLLADGPHRAAAARLGREVRSMPGAARGADVVEELVGVGRRRTGANGAG